MKRQFIYIVLFLFVSLCSEAQELYVQNFALSPNDIIPTNEQRKDLNGKYCALVKIQVVDDIDRVEGNVIGGIVNRGVEKWVFVTEGTKEFRLFPKAHLPLSISCNIYGIDGLESRRVYILRLTSNQVAVIPEKTDSINTVLIPEAKKEEPILIEEQIKAEEPVRVEEPKYEEPLRSEEPIPMPDYTYQSSITTPLKSQSDNRISFGIRAGLNMASTQFEDSYKDVSMATSFHLGVSLDVPFSDKLALTTALLYSGKGYKYDKLETATAQYIDVPIQLSLRFGDIDTFQFQVNAGPYIGIGIGGKIKSETSSEEVDFFKHYESFDFGATIGLGALISKHFYIGVGYQLGMGKYRNRNINVSIGYNF